MGGGIAGLGVVCDNSTFFSTVGDSDGLTGPNKGAGWSGSFENTSIGWIRLSAHEFGHQFDALHTFNGNGSGNCVGGISSSSAYEIGSGTTLMSYEGLCSSSQNVPPSGENDNYFHSTSLDRMRNYLESADGNCAGVIPNSNAVPVASHAYAANPIIPIGTPFELEGTGTDTDNDNLTYLWEQIDEDGNGAPTQGFIGSAAANSAIAPLFKSVPPSETGFRVFPQLSHILQGENENQSFEALPQINREINFSFIVRDNAGGVNSTGLMVESSDSAGPFRVSSQNVATTWIADGNSTETIFWEVANTDNSIINCQTVDIWLSSDNGNNFDFPLAENVPNSGSFSFVIPNLNTSTGRIKIKASNNVFFDINDTSIIIESGCEANGTAFSPDADFMANTGDASLDLNLSPEYGSAISSFSGELTTADFGTSLAAGSGSCVNFNLNTTFADSYAFQVSEAGTYTFSKTSGAFGLLVHLYDGEFIPSSPCTNWVTGSFNVSTSMLENGISVDLLPGIDYTLVVGGFNATLPSSLPQTYSYSCSGPGNCVDGLLAPSGFSYTYIISDSDNVIVDINSDPDLTSFSGGIYTITGLSYDSSLNISSYMNANFSELENDLLSLVFCGNLSSNDLTVEILSADTCAGDFNFDGIITASDLTIFLSEFGCLEDCQADLNGDDIVTATDLTLMLSLFGTLCP